MMKAIKELIAMFKELNSKNAYFEIKSIHFSKSYLIVVECYICWYKSSKTVEKIL